MKIWFAIFFIISFLIGYGFHASKNRVMQPEVADAVKTIWTCSMHPQIREDKPGKCRLCGMDLIPITSGGTDETTEYADRTIPFSPEAVKLMEIQTSLVERKEMSHEVRLVGKIALDETRTKTITAWVPGRIDRLFVDFTGITVNKGDHMVELYSPELITAQAEFLQAIESTKTLDGSTELVSRSIRQTLEASREKLRLLGLTEQQIADIEKASKPLDQLTVYAPIGGVVIDKKASEGMYVKTGTPIYTIADMSTLWVLLDVYESQLSWIQFGRAVEFTTESWPGEIFKGRISFVSPILDDKTRTVKVRAVVENAAGKLKPNMLVHALVSVPVTEQGPAAVASLADKWICPMHGEIVEDTAGQCPVCGMDLVTAKTLGYGVQGDATPPLAIPATAALVTGRKLNKAVVYVQVEGADKPTFMGREVTLGPRAGDYYVVLSGLMEGERVVTNGNFKIDSEMQIRAKSSMMSMEQKTPEAMASKEQTHCPVMGGVINKEVFTEYQGKKVYFCCPGCIDGFNKEPEKYVHKLPQFSNNSK
ncbi:MAG: efflux RND transporter periplasmic adaptor subunit [Planctomycetes bacterium]|nr:efflux RND transporter periplasmic adaptor subunit [Planctomycetota bacterium]